MSLTRNRATTTDRTDFTADERAYLVAWGDENGLEVSIKPAVAGSSGETAFVGYGDGIVSWMIYRADGLLWLCHVEGQAEQGREGSKVAIEAVDEALARILIETEA